MIRLLFLFVVLTTSLVSQDITGIPKCDDGEGYTVTGDPDVLRCTSLSQIEVPSMNCAVNSDKSTACLGKVVFVLEKAKDGSFVLILDDETFKSGIIGIGSNMKFLLDYSQEDKKLNITEIKSKE